MIIMYTKCTGKSLERSSHHRGSLKVPTFLSCSCWPLWVLATWTDTTQNCFMGYLNISHTYTWCMMIYIYIYNCNIVYITLHNLFIVSYKSDSKKYLNKFTHLLVRSRPVAFFRHVQRGKFVGFRSRWWLGSQEFVHIPAARCRPIYGISCDIVGYIYIYMNNVGCLIVITPPILFFFF